MLHCASLIEEVGKSQPTVTVGDSIMEPTKIPSSFQLERWAMTVSQPSQYTPLWPACRSAGLDKTRSSTPAEVRRVWELYDHRLQSMNGVDVDPFA